MTPTDDLVKQGIAAAQAGRRAEALRLFRQALALDPNNFAAWLWRGGLAADPSEALACLQRAVALKPQDERARQGLAWAQQRLATDERARGEKPAAPAPAAQAAPATSPAAMAAPGEGGPPDSRFGVSWREGRAIREAGRPVPRLAPTRRPRRAAPSRASLFAVLALLLVGVVLIAATIFVLAGGGSAADRPASTPSPVATGRPGAAPTATVLPTLALIATPTPAPILSWSELQSRLDSAWAQEDWAQAIGLLEQMRAANPADKAVQEKLFAAHFNYGIKLVRSEQLPEAVAQFDEALKIKPGDVNAQGERLFAQLYWEGGQAYARSDWAAAIDRYQEIFDGNPNYRQVRQRLYAAYYNQGTAFQTQGKLLEAQDAYQKALLIDFAGMEAQAALEQVNALLPPPPPGAKRIEISLSEQRLYAYEGDRLIYKFVVCTGQAKSPTMPGNFRILDKIRYADAPSLKLKYPYWMGIYWVGKLENGIHALPYDYDGKLLWKGFLGRPCSFGCIVLDTPDAIKLYNWAEIGTAVKIYR
jgi:tetratricopeptide (TPR) repeat protein